MTLTEAIAKATKLLRLSESSNPHEAALAAQRAQEILTRYGIDAAALSADADGQEPDEAIENFGTRAPLDAANARVSTWKLTLASRVANANQCRAYQSANTIGIIGRPSAVEKVRYLYDLLVGEVDRLTEQNGKGCGRTWRTQFRYGVVDAIAAKLAEAQAKVAADMRAETTGTALVRVNRGIAKLEKDGREVDAWMARNMRLRSKKSYTRSDPGAREAGRQAGASISLSGARASLSA